MPEVSLVSIIKNPAEAYHTCVDKGAELCGRPAIFLFHSSFMAGCYIGFGGLLALVISGNMPEVQKNNPGFVSLLFALLFPVNLIIIMLTGGLLFTGASMTTVAAVIEGKAKPFGTMKVLFVSWWGNFIGSAIFALFTEWCGLVDGPARAMALRLTIKKTSMSFGACFARGIGCNWLVCLAVYLSTMAQDLTGKYVAILLCISCFVAIGFEHIPANFYTLSVGYIYNRQFNESTANPSVGDIWGKNFIPCTLGNFWAGAFCMAAQYSFAYGRLAFLWKPAPKADAVPSHEKTDAKEAQMQLKFSDEHEQKIVEPQEIILVTTASLLLTQLTEKQRSSVDLVLSLPSSPTQEKRLMVDTCYDDEDELRFPSRTVETKSFEPSLATRNGDPQTCARLEITSDSRSVMCDLVEDSSFQICCLGGSLSASNCKKLTQ